MTRNPVDNICCCLCIPIVGHGVLEGGEDKVLTLLLLLRILDLEIDANAPRDNFGGKLFDVRDIDGGEKHPF